MLQTKETQGPGRGRFKDPGFRFQTSECAVVGEAARRLLSESKKQTGGWSPENQRLGKVITVSTSRSVHFRLYCGDF